MDLYSLDKKYPHDFYLDKNIDFASNDLNTWIDIFYKRADAAGIFHAIRQHPAYSSSVSAKVVGAKWHAFSEFMPWFLCQAAANVSSNTKRTYICRPAYTKG